MVGRPTNPGGVGRRAKAGYRPVMKIVRTAALAGVAKKLYDESRKPENQRRIKAAMDQVKARKAQKPRH